MDQITELLDLYKNVFIQATNIISPEQTSVIFRILTKIDFY
jgi:hypothetical protein